MSEELSPESEVRWIAVIIIAKSSSSSSSLSSLHKFIIDIQQDRCTIMSHLAYVIHWIAGQLRLANSNHLYAYYIPTVLGPLVFSIYATGVSNIIVSHDCHLHLYADNTQVYVSIPVDAASSVTTRLYCRCCNVV